MDKEEVDAACARAREKAAARLAAACGVEDGKPLEVACWNWAIRRARRNCTPRHWDHRGMRSFYIQKVLSVSHNLRMPEVAAKVLEGSMTPAGLVDAHPHSLNPPLWENAYLSAHKMQFRREVHVDVQNAPEGAFTCSRCKSKKTVYNLVQIRYVVWLAALTCWLAVSQSGSLLFILRSADEPAHCFVTCLGCNKRWKISA